MLTRRLCTVLLLLTLAACNLPTSSSIPTESSEPVEDSTPIIVETEPTDEPLIVTETPVPAASALTLEQLKNAEIKITGVMGDGPTRTVRLIDGKFESNADPPSTDYVNANMGSQVAFGDLNG